jgi:hypothetical protein
VKLLGRRLAVLLLALIVGAVAAAPHWHDLLADLSSGESFAQRIGPCEGSAAAHFHAARTTAHQHACVACARQQTVGAAHVVPLHVVLPAVLAAHVDPIGAPRDAAVRFALLRGPPAA